MLLPPIAERPVRRPTRSTTTKQSMSSAGISRVTNPERTRSLVPTERTLDRANVEIARTGTTMKNVTTITVPPMVPRFGGESFQPLIITDDRNTTMNVVNTTGQMRKSRGKRRSTVGAAPETNSEFTVGPPVSLAKFIFESTPGSSSPIDVPIGAPARIGIGMYHSVVAVLMIVGAVA